MCQGNRPVCHCIHREVGPDAGGPAAGGVDQFKGR